MTADMFKRWKRGQCRRCRSGRWDNAAAVEHTRRSRRSDHTAETPYSLQSPCRLYTFSPPSASHSPPTCASLEL